MNLSADLENAIRDYYYLLEKGYSAKRLEALSGDRYHLNSEQRSVLYRGITTKAISQKRANKIIEEITYPGKDLFVDLLNQMYSVAGYLCGKLVYISSDGYLRDVCEKHSSSFDPPILERSLELILKFSAELPVGQVYLLLDEQVNISDQIQEIFHKIKPGNQQTISIQSSDKVDHILEEVESQVISTSDSTIIDRSNSEIFDLARATLNTFFTPKIPDIRNLIGKI